METVILRLRSDATLVREALAGHSAAFEVLIARYQSQAEAIALAIGVRPDAIPDLLQEVFLLCFRDLSGLRKPESFGPWLLSILRNRARMSLRRRGRHTLPLVQDVEEPATTDEVEMDEVRTELWRAVDTLPEGVREAICLYYYRGSSVKAVAKTLGISRSAAKDRLQRGRNALREKMWRKFGETVREMVPNRREREYRARNMSLLVMSTVALDRTAAGPVGGSAVPASGGLASGAVALGGKKIVGLTLGVLLVAAVGVAVFRGDGGAAKEGGDRGQEGSTVASVDAEAGVESRTGGLEGPDSGRVVKSDPMEGTLPPPPVDLRTADRERDLFGIVVDEDGQPIAGAMLQAVEHPRRRHSSFEYDLWWSREYGPQTRSSSDGSFRLSLRPGQVVSLQAEADDYADTVIPLCNPGERLRVVLGEPCQLRVKVHDPRKKPVSGAAVKFYQTRETYPLVDFHEPLEAITDHEGRVVFSRLQSGMGRIQVSHPSWDGLSRHVEMRSGDPVDVEVVLRTQGVISGSVTDAATGEPIVGATVDGGIFVDIEVRTDAMGRYEVGGVGGQFFGMVRVTADGYGSQQQRIPPQGDLDFEMERGEIVHGIVADPEGQVLGGVSITVGGDAWDDIVGTTDSFETLSATDGTFELSGVHSGIIHMLTVAKRGHGTLSKVLDHSTAEGGRVDLGTLTLPHPRRIEGTVATGEGSEPLGRTLVTLTVVLENTPAGFDPMRYGPLESRCTDDLGRFRFVDLAPGPYRLTVHRVGAPETCRSVRLPPDRDLLDVRIPLQEGKRVTVIVEDGTGTPLEGVNVSTYLRPQEDPVQVLTDSRGRAVLHGFPQGQITISVSARGYLSPEPREVRPAGQEERFVLEEAVVIRGTVRDAADEPVFGLNIQATSTTGSKQVYAGWSDYNGSFSISCHRGSVVDLRIQGSPHPFFWTGEDAKSYYGEVLGVVAPAEGVVIVVREPDRTLGILALDPDGQPVPWASVVVYAPGFSTRENPRKTGEDGRVRLEGLPLEVSVQVTASPESGLDPSTFNRRTIQVRADGQEEVVQLEMAQTVRGVVVDTDGRPVAGATIRAGPDSEDALSFSDREGRYTIEVPGQGPHQINAIGNVGENVWVGTVEGVMAPSEGVTIVVGEE